MDTGGCVTAYLLACIYIQYMHVDMMYLLLLEIQQKESLSFNSKEWKAFLILVCVKL